jgi:hypothetical protein
MLDFPNAPTVNQVFTSGPSWMWDGVKWKTTGAADTSYTVNTLTPATGATVTLADFRPVFINTGTLAALTIRLPPSPSTSSHVEISFAAPVTGLTIQDSGGGALANMPTSSYGPGAALMLRYATGGWVYWK